MHLGRRVFRRGMPTASATFGGWRWGKTVRESLIIYSRDVATGVCWTITSRKVCEGYFQVSWAQAPQLERRGAALVVGVHVTLRAGSR